MGETEVKDLIKASLKKAFDCLSLNDNINAEELYRQILRVSPNEREALELGGLVLCRNGKPDEALAWCIKSISLGESYETYNTLGLIHGHLGDSKNAIKCFRKGISLNPKECLLYVNLAVESKKTDIFSALSILDESPIINEHILFNKGAILQEIGKPEEAKHYYLKALDKKYEFPVCHYNLSACYFLLNDYKNGWKEYEWRWKQFDRFIKVRERFKEPFWNGEDLTNKTIVLYCEQGIGDLIMGLRFAKYLPGKVIIECPGTIHRLITDYEVCEKYEGHLDYHCSLLSIPNILGIGIKFDPYIHVEKNDWNVYQDVKKIGICWAGSPIHPNDRNRSCLLSHFKNLEKHGKVFSFQKDSRAHGYHDDKVIDFVDCKMDYVDLSPFLVDFQATASFLSQMDLVISVDTSIVHLAGAMGIKTWLLLPYNPDWRWGLKEKTDWYDNITIFRKENWEKTFEDVYIALGQIP